MERDIVDNIGLPAGLSTGARLTLTVEDLAFGGEGVGRVEGFVVFVPFVIPGEEVEVEVLEIKRNFARARLVRVLSPSPDRVSPPCRYFGECGGCQYQHIDYPRQLALKHKQVTDLLERIGGVPASAVEPIVPCPVAYGYRNRIMLRSQWNKVEKRLDLGFLRYDNRLVVDIDECKIAEPTLNDQIKKLRSGGDESSRPVKGGLKIVLRVVPDEWEVPRDSFFQNNLFLLPRLVQVAREMLALPKQTHPQAIVGAERPGPGGAIRFLIDAYCGVGFFAIELADLVERFVGVELDQQAVRAARRNASARHRTNGEFIVGKTEDYLPNILTRFKAESTALVLDPPRTGCPRPSLELIRQCRPALIIYVSCHPATLARDLNVLCSGDVFELERVKPLDMFPQTQHVECVAALRAPAGR